MKKTNVLLLLCIYLFFSCSAKKNAENEVDFDEFPFTSKVILEDYLDLGNSHPVGAILFTDTSIITVNTNHLIKDYLFYEYSKNSKKLVGKYVKWGAKKNRVISPMSYGLNNGNTLWVHDLSLNKVVTVPLKNKYSLDSITGIQDYKISEFAYSTQLMDSNKILKSGIFNAPEYLQIAHLENGELEKKIGIFEGPTKEHTRNIWKAAYEGFLFLKPDEEKAVIACRYTDRIEIFNLKTGTLKSIIGPRGFHPIFISINENSVDNFSISRTENTIFAFLGGSVTNHYIYLMYSGKTEQEDNYNRSNEIYVYDWDGNPIKKLLLDRHVLRITIPEGDTLLYASDPKLNIYLKAKIK